MIRNICFIVVALVVLQCVFSSSAVAQSNPCMKTPITWGFFDPMPFGWFYYSSYAGTYQYLITAWKASCVPPGPAPCPHCPSGGLPISLATGNTFIEQSDLRIPGLGGGLSLTRTWNSAWPPSLLTFRSGIFGPNWRSTYEERIVLGLDNYIKYLRSDGSAWSFGLNDSGAWVVAAPANIFATLNTDTSVNPFYTLTFQSGEQRRFDKTTGNLIAIIDRNGNTTTVAYDSSGRLATITDAASRHLTFNYSGANTVVTSVTTDAGITLTYSYDSQGRLVQITKPDLTTINFAYNTQSLITSVTDSNGKVLESHTYDAQARGLTSTRANGVEALTITYPQ